MEYKYDKKTDALLEMVNAFSRRGRWLQYDQLSLDRVAQISSRRIATLPPEAATEDKYTFYDCSSLCWALYYQTFGYMMESYLTWHMVDIVEPKVFYYELTHKETEEEIKQLTEEIRSILRPGDVITYAGAPGGYGHAMMYVGDNRYVNSSQGGEFNGYNYSEKKNVFHEKGGVRFENIEGLFREAAEGEDPKAFRNYLFGEKKRCFSIARPLDVCGEPTKQAMIRLLNAKDLYFAVSTGNLDGKTLDKNKEITYKLVIKNYGNEDKKASVTFEAPEGTKLLSGGSKDITIKPGEETEDFFTVKPDEDNKYPVRLEAPHVKVNGLDIYAPRVEIGRVLSDDETKELLNKTENSADTVQTALDWYSDNGAAVKAKKNKLFYRYFALQDGAAGDIVYRYPVCYEDDIAAPRLYGGLGCVCTDNTTGYDYRTVIITEKQLLPGDIIIVSDDATGKKQYSALYTGKGLKGQFEYGEEEKYITGKDMAEFIDSLYGRFVFIVLRPSLSMK